MKSHLVFYFLVLLWFTAKAGEYDFTISDDQPPETMRLSGNLDGKYSLFEARPNSPIFQLQYANQSLENFLAAYNMGFYLNGDYQTKDFGIYFRTFSEYSHNNEISASLYELYANLNLSINSHLLFGKHRYSWGKGYAFNPVGYVNSLKDPENPELAQSGLLSMNFEFAKSFNLSSVNNATFELVMLPAAESINNKIYEFQNTDLAARMYFLIWDTDIDFMGYYSRVNPNQAGFDFSRNIFPSLEIHGEYSQFYDQTKSTITDATSQSERLNGSTWLLGLRWLNQWNITSILEYYRNEAGLTKSEFTNYHNFLQNAAASGNPGEIAQAMNIQKSGFSSIDLMQDYLYLKISWPEPFNWVYFTPSVYTILNLNDRSAIIGIPLSYKPVTNFEFLCWPAFLTGKSGTEYGTRQYKRKLDLWFRFYF